jgi:putative FmdB family regulatory protein
MATRRPAADRAAARHARIVPGSAYAGRMPRYDFRCRACGATFEVSRPMADSSEPAPCPAGHDDTVKLLSTVAVTGRSSAASSLPSPASGGGCCGGACGCG